jgi:hypothetical protein
VFYNKHNKPQRREEKQRKEMKRENDEIIRQMLMMMCDGKVLIDDLSDGRRLSENFHVFYGDLSGETFELKLKGKIQKIQEKRLI